MENKGFVWYGIRYSFWIMVLGYILYNLIIFTEGYYASPKGVIFLALFVSIFSIFSILLSIAFILKNKENREFAITSLILALIILFILLMPFLNLLPK